MRRIFGMALVVLLLGSSVEAVEMQEDKVDTKTDATTEKLSKSATYFYNQGRLAFSQGKTTEAIQSFSRVIEIDSENVSAYQFRARLYQKMKEYELALNDAIKVVEKTSPPTASSYLFRGLFCEKWTILKERFRIIQGQSNLTLIITLYMKIGQDYMGRLENMTLLSRILIQ
jgi:Tetratricopeptide repeat.